MNRMLFRNAQVPMSPYGVDDTVYKSRVSHHSEQLLSTQRKFANDVLQVAAPLTAQRDGA